MKDVSFLPQTALMYKKFFKEPIEVSNSNNNAQKQLTIDAFIDKIYDKIL